MDAAEKKEPMDAAEKKEPMDAAESGESLTSAADVDRMSEHPYATSRPDCSAHFSLTDPLKDVVLPIEQMMREMTQITAAEEATLGAEALALLPGQFDGKLIEQGTTVDYLRSVAEPLLAQVSRSEIDYRFYVLTGSGMENAMALPGGNIVVTQELLEGWVENEAQLATVLGHEIAHVDARHPVAIVQYTRAAGIPDDLLMAQVIAHLMSRPYSSVIEQEADRHGAHLMHAAGYSVFQAVELWQAQGDTVEPTQSTPALPSGGLFGAMAELALSEMNNLLTTHPDAAKRACHLQQVAFELYQSEPRPTSYVGRSNWRQQHSMLQKVY